MSVEELRKIAKEEASKFIMENLNSAIIFTYIQNLEKVIEKQQKEIEKLLKAYKQDEKIIQEMAEYIKNEWGFANNDEVIDYFRKRCK